MADETRNTVGGSARVGIVAQAQTMEAHFHTGTPLPPPHQLAPPDRCFQNREAEIDRIIRLASEAPQPGAPAEPRVVVLSGMPGIGKTALAHEIGHRIADRYPDGVLSEDLTDYRGSDTTVDLSELLGNLLRALRLPPELQAGGQGPRLRQYRSQTAGRRLLFILDGVLHRDEAAQLLPSAGHSLVLIIAQTPQRALATDSAHEIHLGPLTEQHSTELLSRLLGEHRIAAEAGTVPELLGLCGGLPLALRVTGSHLAEHELHSLARSVADIREEGLPMVEALWDAAYRTLPSEAARLYRLLPTHPAPSFCVDAAVALLGAGRYVGEDALSALLRAHLLERDPTHSDRFRLTGLLHPHATRRARLDGLSQEAEAAQRRIVRWYRRQAERADRLVQADRLRIAAPLPEQPDAPDVAFADSRAATRWIHRERHALYSSVLLARRLGLLRDAWSLCEPLWPHSVDQAVHVRATEAFQAGVEAAEEDEHPQALARMRCQLASPLWQSGETERAEAVLAPAVAAADALGHERLHASVLEFAGKLRLARNEPGAAAEWFEAARKIHEQLPDSRYGVLLQTYLLGLAQRREGRLSDARDLQDRAHRMARERGHLRMTGRTAWELGRCCHELGATRLAAAWYASALESAEQRDATPDQAALHSELADLARETADPAAEERHLQAAADLRAMLAAQDDMTGPETGDRGAP